MREMYENRTFGHEDVLPVAFGVTRFTVFDRHLNVADLSLAHEEMVTTTEIRIVARNRNTVIPPRKHVP